MLAISVEVQLTPSAGIVLIQNSPNQYLEVATAFAQRPDVVRDALLEALRHVQLRSIDITLLRIEYVFRSTLEKPWKESKTFRPVLEACRQGKLKSRTEQFFYNYGKEFGVVALGVATREDDHKLFRDIDLLSDDELVKLVNAVQLLPKRSAILGFIEDFVDSPGASHSNSTFVAFVLINIIENGVADPPPCFPRPRTRRTGL